MAKAHLFNPENDLALAAGTANFTPPRAAAALRDAGASLPAWWAADTDCVLGVDPDEAERLRRRWGITFATEAAPADEAAPWGWSAYARRIFSLAGLTGLPDDSRIDRLRELSHRRTAMSLLRTLGIDDVIECRTLAEVERAVSRGPSVMKSPWSCSGRGVMYTRGMSRDEIRRHAAGTIRRQGSIMVEPMMERAVDFAALFNATPSGLNFAGWSIFTTSAAGAYTGNVVAPQPEIEERLDSLTPIGTLRGYAAEIAAQLGAIIGGAYTGPLGVDMMLCGRDMTLRPCIEVNLRRTMGHAAIDIHRRTSLRGTLAFSPSAASRPQALSLSPAGSGFILAGAQFGC